MATSAVELERLDQLEQRAGIHGLDCERLGEAGLRRREPNVAGLGGFEVASAGRQFSCERLVACAGLQSDRLAELAGVDIDVQIIPFRGEYFALPAAKSGYVKHLIYPVPDPALPFLGVPSRQPLTAPSRLARTQCWGWPASDTRSSP